MLTPKEQLRNIPEYNLINKTLYFVKLILIAMKKLLILTLILISSCQEKLVKNDAPLSGIIDQENETIIVEKLAQGYVDGKLKLLKHISLRMEFIESMMQNIRRNYWI